MQKIFNFLQLAHGIYLIALGEALGLWYHLVKGMSESTYTVKIYYIFSACLWHWETHNKH